MGDAGVGFERVHAELDWYDGPRAGVADVGGVPHYFRAIHDYRHPDDVYHVWPASPAALALEREQWVIFTEWNTRYEAATATPDSHPGHGAIDRRYDELTALLAPHRAVPPKARRLKAEWRHADRPQRYHPDGPDYVVRRHPRQFG
jgi:hypothetical protein